MPTLLNADRVAHALLRYFREPVLNRAEMLHENAVTGNLDLVVKLALGRPVGLSTPELQDPGAAKELARAAVFYVQQTLFRDGASHYQILGLTPDASPEAIRESRRLLIQVVHPDRHNTPIEWPESVAARVNRAYSVLRNADARAAYDQQEALAQAAQEPGTRSGPVFPAAPGLHVRARRQVPTSALPEWLTNGVGGFFRDHPAFTIFASLIALSLLVISWVIWAEHDVTLTRQVPEAAAVPGAAPRAQGAAAGQAKDVARRSAVSLEASDGADARVVGRSADAADPTGASKAEAGATRAPNPAAIALARLEGQIAAREAKQPPAVAAVQVALQWTAAPAAVVPEPTQVVLAKGTPVVESQPVAVSQPVAAPQLVVAPRTTAAAAAEPATPAAISIAAAVPPAAPPIPKPSQQSVTSANIAATTSATTSAAASATARASPPLASVLATVAPVAASAPRPATMPIPAEPQAPALSQAPDSADVEALIAAFISSYEGGNLDAFATLFDVDVRTNEFRGRAAVRSEYNELFQRSSWRKMSLKQMRWRAVGERTEANGEFALKIGWRDGREVEQRVAVEMDLVRKGGRTVIARLSQQVRN